MAGGPIQIWNEWAIQILILLSFALQIFLFLFARTRRHGPSAVLKILLWLAYLMADSTAVYTLGHLSMYGFPREQKLAVLWAPFLLVHLGSQDTITAYALEDNKLWPRHLLNLGVQAFAVAYVLYKHIAEIPTLLGLATGLMFVVGLIKYGERIWALKCATLDNMLRSIREYRPLPTYYSLLLPPQGLRAEERDEEEFLLFAHAMLPLCKGAMADVPVTLFRSRSDGIRLYNSYRWNWNWKATLKVVEMELSLVYDILYTKAVVIHNWYGYSIRVFSLLATIVVFILLQLSGNKDDYSKVDVAITYILLVAAFLLDLASVLGALGSTWTCNLLWTRGWSQLGLVILSLRRHLNTARGNRGWSGSIGQFNLLRFSSRDKTKLSIRMAKMMGLEDLWNNWRHTETVVISEDVKDLVFHHVWQVLKKIADPRWEYVTLPPRPYEEQPTAIMPINNGAGFAPEPYKETAMRRMKLAQALSFDAQLQEVILTWHICTDVFLLRSGTAKDMDAASSTYLKAIKALSNYMVFLIAVRPDTIAGLELRSMFETTRDALDKVWSKSGQNQYPTAEEKLAHFMQNGCSHVIVQRGNTYASMLLGLLPIKDDMFMPHYCCVYSADRDLWKHLMPDLELSPDGDVCTGGDVFDIPKVLVLIFDAWVRLLIFASVRCSRDAHARQINRGGELTTVVWLMQEHAAMFLKLTEEELFSRNRYELEEKNQVMSD